MPLPSYDYDLDQQNLLRRQQMAEAMMQGGIAPLGNTEVVSGVAVKRSPMEAIGKIIQAYMGAKGIQSVTDDQRGLADRYKGDLKSGVQKLIEGLSATPGNPTTVDDESGGHTGPGMTPQGAQAAKRAAVMEAIGSNVPALQQMGMTYLTQMQKQNLEPKDLISHADPKSIPDMVQYGVAGFRPKPRDLKEVNGVVYDQDTKQIVQLKSSTPPEHIKIDGDYYEVNQSTGQLKKLDNAPKVTVNTPGINFPGQKKGAETLFSEHGKRVEKLGEIAQNATNNLQAISELKNLESQGIFSNVTSGPKTFMANLGQSLGVPVDEQKLGNTEGFRSVATDLWQGIVSKYGGNRGITSQESEQLKQIIPQAAQSPQARAKMYDILERLSQRQIEQYQNAHKNFTSAVQADDVTKLEPLLMQSSLPQPTTPNPATPAKAAPAVQTLEEYLKSKRGGR